MTDYIERGVANFDLAGPNEGECRCRIDMGAGLFAPRRVDDRDRGAAHDEAHDESAQQWIRDRLVNRRRRMLENRAEDEGRNHE